MPGRDKGLPLGLEWQPGVDVLNELPAVPRTAGHYHLGDGGALVDDFPGGSRPPPENHPNVHDTTRGWCHGQKDPHVGMTCTIPT